MTDLVIRNGTVIDGTGAEPFEADVAIDGGKIAAVGKIASRGAEEIDARGMLVTPGLRRSAHALRRPGDLEQPHHAFIVERRHHHAVRQLRRRLRALQAVAARDAGEADGGRGGHPRGRADRGPAVELAELSRFPRCAGRASLRHGHRDAGAARRAARVRHGRARRRSRTRHRAGPRGDGTARGGRDQGGRSGFLDLAHAEPQDAGWPLDPDAGRGRGGTCRDCRRAARHRQGLDAGDLGLRRCRGRVRHAAPPGGGVAQADGDHAAAARRRSPRSGADSPAGSPTPMPRACRCSARC